MYYFIRHKIIVLDNIEAIIKGIPRHVKSPMHPGMRDHEMMCCRATCATRGDSDVRCKNGPDGLLPAGPSHAHVMREESYAAIGLEMRSTAALTRALIGALDSLAIFIDMSWSLVVSLRKLSRLAFAHLPCRSISS